MNKEKVLDCLKLMKEIPFGGSISEDDFKIMPLTRDRVEDDIIINLLVRWRKENQFWFRDMFDVTVDSTKKWYIDQLTNKGDRISFMIKVKDNYIGHIGLNRFDFDNSSCSLDNIIRGESLYKGIMFETISYLHEWGRDILEIDKYTLETCSNNYRALNLYKNLGYVEIKRDPMRAIETSSGIEWVSTPKNYKDNINRYNIHMEKTYE